MTTRRRGSLALVMALSALTVLVAPAPPAGSQVDEDDVPTGPIDRDGWPGEPVSWLALGDSFSSGEGLSTTIGGCHQNHSRSYPFVAKEELSALGFPAEAPEMFACSGAHIVSSAESRAPQDLADQIDLDEARGPDKRWDLVTLTIGGNDAGFGPTLEQCILPQNKLYLPYGFADGLGPVFRACWALMYELHVFEDLHARHPIRFAVQGHLPNAGTMQSPVNWDLHDEMFEIFESNLVGTMGLDEISTRLRSALARLIDTRLRDGGHIVVLGYPRLFEPPSNWGQRPFEPDGGGLHLACWRVHDPFAEVFRRAADKLNAAIEEATADYPQVTYLDTAEAFEDHNACTSSGDPWVNGLTGGVTALDTLPVTLHGSGSFHPNAGGYSTMGELLADHIADLGWGNLGGGGGGGGDDGGDSCETPDASPPDQPNLRNPGTEPDLLASASVHGATSPRTLQDAQDARELVGKFLAHVVNGHYQEATDLTTHLSVTSFAHSLDQIREKYQSGDGPLVRVIDLSDYREGYFVVTAEWTKPYAPPSGDSLGRPIDGDAMAFIVGPAGDEHNLKIHRLPHIGNEDSSWSDNSYQVGENYIEREVEAGDKVEFHTLLLRPTRYHAAMVDGIKTEVAFSDQGYPSYSDVTIPLQCNAAVVVLVVWETPNFGLDLKARWHWVDYGYPGYDEPSPGIPEGLANGQYSIDCPGKPGAYTLEDGDYQDDDVWIHIVDVNLVDLEDSGGDDAVVLLSCAYGAGSRRDFLFAFEGLGDDEWERLGDPLEASYIIRTGEDTYEAYEPLHEPDDPNCCASYYERTVLRVDMSADDAFRVTEGPTTIPADDLPEDPHAPRF